MERLGSWPGWGFARGEPIGSTTPNGHGKAEFSEEAAHGVDTCSASGQIARAQTVQGVDGLLFQGFDGDRSDVFVSGSL